MAEKPPEGPRDSEDRKDSADDVWERFVRDSELGIRTSGAPKEPSARARMVTERLRQQDARGELPPGWRTGPAWREMDGRAARRRKLWAIIGVPLVVAVALVAMKPSLLPGDPFGTGGTGGTGTESAAPLPEETAPPSTAPSSAPGTPTLDRPFAGSPAARYADGAAGIVPGEAHGSGQAKGPAAGDPRGPTWSAPTSGQRRCLRSGAGGEYRWFGGGAGVRRSAPQSTRGASVA